MPSNHLIPCSLFSSHLQSFPASGSFPMSRFIISGAQIIWSFSFSISPSDEYSGLISFRIDWFDLLAVQGTLQHHSFDVWKHQFFGRKLNFLYGSTLTSIHYYWKIHSVDYTDHCRQSDVSAFWCLKLKNRKYKIHSKNLHIHINIFSEKWDFLFKYRIQFSLLFQITLKRKSI